MIRVFAVDDNLPACPQQAGCKQPAGGMQASDISTFRLFGAVLGLNETTHREPSLRPNMITTGNWAVLCGS